VEHERAIEVRAGSWLPGTPFYQDPLFPYLLAALIRAVGSDVASIRVALACLGALTPVTILWAGRRGLGRTEGIVAGLAAAVYGPMVFADALLDKEGVAALVAALALGLTAVASKAEGGGRWAASMLAGAAWGLLALLRANALLIGPMGAAWQVWGVGGRGPWRWIAAAAFLGGFGAALAPVTIVNLAV